MLSEWITSFKKRRLFYKYEASQGKSCKNGGKPGKMNKSNLIHAIQVEEGIEIFS